MAASADAFIFKLNPERNALIYSTYVGGAAGSEVPGSRPIHRAAYVTGWTQSTNLPTSRARSRYLQ